ncbi:MAG TPA: Uma2 family endonuclease [Blastocatellia bacterium]|nr:Uma2 family endonuclease [Blastocatellia bacterium]
MSTAFEPLLTIDDLAAMPDDGNRYEIIEGELLVSRSPSLTHQSVSINLVLVLTGYLSQSPIGRIWTTPGVILSEFSAVIPDLAFVSNERLSQIASSERITGPPDLMIEIVSPGAENERRDRIAKRQLYGRYGVREYWVVDPIKRRIEVFCLDGQALNLRAAYSEQDELTSSVLPGFACKVEMILRS